LTDTPDPCLLKVLSYLTANPASLFSAARAHSRLHQAAVPHVPVAASSISTTVSTQQKADNIVLYLDTHGQHVSSIFLRSNAQWGVDLQIRELPLTKLPSLSYLEIQGLGLQLQPGSGFQDVLGAAAPIKQLRLYLCQLLDEGFQLAPALALLPDLEHLSYSRSWRRQSGTGTSEYLFPVSVLHGLLQLTSLELSVCEWDGQDDLRELQGLTRMRDLRLGPRDSQSRTLTISACVLSSMRELT
jgi:hypothetical protein